MVIKSTKRNYWFFLGVLVCIALSVITLSKRDIATIKADTLQYIMGLDPGFSHRVSIVDSGEGIYLNGVEAGFSKYQSSILPSLINVLPEVIKYKSNATSLERIDIDIKYIDYKKIIEDRKRALIDNILVNPISVKAKIRFKGKTYKAKIRLKGDTIKHWDSFTRMSLRVNLKGGNSIFGFNRFSIQKPISRHHPYDHAFQSMVRETGNLASVYHYSKVYVNGVSWGVMNIEEHASKELLEKQNRKESAIIRFSDEKYWSYSNKTKHPPYPFYRLSDPSLYAHMYNGNKYLSQERYRKILTYIVNHNISYEPELYDAEKIAKAYILATAWGSWHTLGINNTRYYFNPYTLKLEPITTDQTGYVTLKGRDSIRYYNYLPNQYYNIMSENLYANNINNMHSVYNVVKDIDRYLNAPSKIFPADRKKNGSVVTRNMERIMLDPKEYLVLLTGNKLHIPRAGPDLTHSYVGDERTQIVLPTKEQASEFNEHLHIRHYTDGRLELYNLLPDEVVITDILFMGKSIKEGEIIVPSYLDDSKPVIIYTEHTGLYDNNFMVKTKYKGFDSSVNSGVTLMEGDTYNPLLSDVPPNSNLLIKMGENDYKFKGGETIVDDRIIINGNLRIPAGAKIKFSDKAYLIVKGAIIAEGNVNSPIVLESKNKTWKGIYIFSANERSHLSNVYIKNVGELHDGMLELSGAVTFYRSDVDLDSVTITGVTAEDAINIVESDFSMKFVKIDNVASDGLDSDFSSGLIYKSGFKNIGGDALDFSGSRASIDSINVTNVKDKAISGGEKSIINVDNSKFDVVGVGVASKDGSKVNVTSSVISNYKLYAAMTYKKKKFYSAPTMELLGCSIGLGDSFLRQTGTYMSVDKSNVYEKDINVKKLYNNSVMMK